MMGPVRTTPIGRWLLALILAASLGGFVHAQQVEPAPPLAAAPAPPTQPPPATPGGPPDARAPESAPHDVARPEVARSVTRSITIGGRTLDYVANVGWVDVINARGTARASLFYTAYILATPATAEARPIIFAFNGGPGAASVYLHLGAMGPRRAVIGPQGAEGTPQLADNAETWLGLGDLVFVDPAGTGLSRTAMNDGSVGDEAFWETDTDIDAMYRFILAYVARFARDRPVYLVGESYGGFRAARLADSLSKLATIRLAGVILISPALDRAAMADDRMMPLAAMLRVPTFAAVAWHHDRVPGVGRDRAARDRFLAEAESWAVGDGLRDLVAGDALSAGRRKQFLASYAHFTGLSPELAAQRDGIVGITEYARTLLGEQGRMLGLYDASVSVPQRGRDPTLRGIGNPLSAAIESYLAGEIGLVTPAKYTTLNPRTNRDWLWLPRGTFGYPNAALSLREALIANHALRVLIVHGRFDLVTPFATTSWAVAQLRLPPERRAAVRLAVLDGGHMMYLHDDSRAALTALAGELIAGGVATAP
jgi:carboxypeptidase C (cathepsin A)